MRVVLLFAAAWSIYGQTATAPAPVKNTLPNWFGVGGEYADASSPHFSGWAAFSLPVSAALGASSFTLEQALLLGGKIVTSVTTGIDDVLKSGATRSGIWTMHGIGTLGGVATPTATKLAAATGGGVMYELTKQWGILPPGFTFEAVALENKAGSTAKPNVLIGIGKTWK